MKKINKVKSKNLKTEATEQALVIDLGSSFIKAGLSGEDSPKVVFPTVVGRPRQGDEAVYVGEEALSKRSTLNLSYPIQQGLVKNFEDLYHIINHVYETLKLPSDKHPVLIADYPLNPKEIREKITKVMFDRFNIPSLFISSSATLSLYSTQRFTGIVLQSGDGYTLAVPILDGFSYPYDIRKIDLTGNDVTDYLNDLLNEKGYSFSSEEDRQTVREIKEKQCYVALDYNQELQKSLSQIQRDITLSNGQKITLGNERFKAPESLFQPRLIGTELYGLDILLLDAISNIELSYQKELYANIVLAGGNTMFPGMADRIKKEISKRVDFYIKVQVTAPENRKYASWIGGSFFASLNGFESFCYTKDEYTRNGLRGIHRKFF